MEFIFLGTLAGGWPGPAEGWWQGGGGWKAVWQGGVCENVKLQKPCKTLVKLVVY